MKYFAVICVLLGAFVFTVTHASAIPVNSRSEESDTDRNQELIGHLANLKAHVQSPLVRKLLEAVKESTEDVDVAVFVQNLLDSQVQDNNMAAAGQSAEFGDKEAEAVLAAIKSLPMKDKILGAVQMVFSIVRTFVTLSVGFMIGRWTG